MDLSARQYAVNHLLFEALHQYVGLGIQAGTPAGNECGPGDLPANVVVYLNPSPGTKSALARRGYSRTRSFLALPSLASPRWLLPLGNGRCDLSGLEIYRPFSTVARGMKGLLTAITAVRCQSWVGRRLLIASASSLPLEDLVCDVTGECHPVFAWLVGATGRFRKLTGQVMSPVGKILGYIKLPVTGEAGQRVRHEAETLNHLRNFPALRPHIPRLLYSGAWGNSHILIQSAGPTQLGPVAFGDSQTEFLQRLRGTRTVEKPGQAIWEEVAARFHQAEPNLSSEWRSLGEAALTRARPELEAVMVPCGIGHGDFAPWNTRVGGQGLYVFDWESASWEAPVAWDVFHFKTQVSALLNKKNAFRLSSDPRTGERACFLLYLLNSACQLIAEGTPDLGRGLTRRSQLLLDQLAAY
jgi:hypothetical protein